MEKRWKLMEILDDSALSWKQQIASHLKCPDLIAELLVRKGFQSVEDINNYFKPSLSNISSPFMFKDMEKTADRIVHAIKEMEYITIYGDYDVDGTTSVALLYLGLKKIGALVDYYIPHRMIDGYGLSFSGIDQLKDRGTNLIISVDCGINANEEVEMINDLGIDIIVTDHHNPKNSLPPAYSIINPKLPDCGYPYKELAGVGVAYQLLMAVYRKLNLGTEELVQKYVDLVALGTIADIVPLTGENRIFASIGLERLLKKNNYGLNALIKIAGLSLKELNTADIVFGIAPRINAAGRMGSAIRAVELMVSNDVTTSGELAEIIERENSLRQQIDQQTFQEACEIIEKKYKDMDETNIIVVSSDNWHPGVIGIVASKLVEKYYRPTILITFKDGIGSASGRSVADFDLFKAVLSVDQYLENFGGHKYAVGLSLLPEYVDIVENRLGKYVREHITTEQLIPPLTVNAKLELYEINENLMEWLAKFAPYGPGNMRPTFYTEKVMVVGFPYNVGRNHLKLKVVKDGCMLDLIGFNMGDFLPMLRKGSFIDIAYSLDINTWQGKTTIQGKLKDIHFAR
jgi:single-stranded-DNA-specific exonuclease